MDAKLHIQCLTPDLEGIGTFLAYRETGDGIHGATLASPVCRDLVELSEWMSANGWEAAPHNPAWPVGVYRKVA